MIFLAVFSVLICTTHGFPSGAPDKACLTMLPLHYVAFDSPLKTPAPYDLVIANDNTLKVTISSNLQFEGFLLKVKNVSDNQNTPIGSFKNLPSNTRSSCNNAAVTHNSKVPKANLTFEWEPPAGYCGTFVYEATIAFNYSTFWNPIQSQNVTIDCPTTTTTTTTTPTPVKPITLSLDPECDKTKKCFHDCSATGCTFLVTYTTTDTEVEFEMTAKMYGQSDQYAVIGFSDDMRMGRDSVVGCIYSGGAVVVEQSYNPALYNMPLTNKTLGLTVLNTFVNNSYIRCKFRRLIVIPADTQIFDLTSDFYLLFATGPVNSGYINKHGKSPTISNKKYSFEAMSSANTTSTTTSTTSKPTTTTTPKPPSITLDPECNKSKSCFHNCGTTSCTYLVTWQVNGQMIDFEIKFLLTNLLDQWVGLGFSSDKSMGSDSVVSCLYRSGAVTVEYSYNPGYYNTPLTDKTKDLTLLSGSMQDNILYCKFRRPVTYTGEPQIFNLDKKWFLFLGNGPILAGGSIGKHFTHPFISPSEMTFANVKETTTAPTTTTTTTTTKSATFTLTLDSECGKSKQCFHDCSQTECTYLVTWLETGQYVQFEITAKMENNGEQWAGVGLSDDRNMGDDYVVACIYRNGNVGVEQSYNPGHYNQPLTNPTLGLSQMSGSIQDSYIKCQFKRDIDVPSDAKIFDLRKPWYLMFGQGILYSGSVGKHNKRPTVSRDEIIFYKSVIPTQPTEPTKPSTTSEKPTTGPSVGGITKDPECSKTKGCFDDCQNGKCSRLVTWKNLADDIEFQIKASVPTSGNFWSAIAFSSDTKMGDDSVIACIHENGQIRVEQSFNPGYYNAPINDEKIGLTVKTTKLENSVLECTFLRKKNVTDPKVFDLNKNWNMLYATGSSIRVKSLGKHSSMPTSSAGTVDFLIAQSVQGTKEDYLLAKVHGCLMIIAWILFASIGIVVARFYKTQWPDSKLLGEKVWFTIHRTSMVFVFLCTCASFIIIFVDVKGYSEIIPPEGYGFLKVHPILGIVVTCLTVINPIMALFRPTPDHKKRPIFNILHWFVGTSALILAVITIFFGLQFEKTGAPPEATHVMIAYCVTFVLIELILEIQRCRALQFSNASDSYEMKPKEETVTTTTRVESIKKDSTLKNWMLALHILAMLAYSLTIVLLILLNKTDDQ